MLYSYLQDNMEHARCFEYLKVLGMFQGRDRGGFIINILFYVSDSTREIY